MHYNALHSAETRIMIKTAFIYDYKPGGKVAGKQVRFKRMRNGCVESTSQYFSIANFGTLSRAYAEAVRWRDRNLRWIFDRRFQPKYLDLEKVRSERRRPRRTR
jgi:hypothetical protein